MSRPLFLPLLTSSLLVLGTVLAAGASAAGFTANDARQIGQLTGTATALEPGGVVKAMLPRTDLHVSVAGVPMTPPMGLTAWAAFQPAGRRTMVMGDMVLTENQVNPIMSVALDNGLSVTALHNHYFWASPMVWYMHLEGMGSEQRLASALGKVFAAIRHLRGKTPSADLAPGSTTLHPAAIEAILGRKGKLSKGVFKLVFGRQTRMDGVVVGPAMGVNTWAAFIGSDSHAVVEGDFAMHQDELQPVLRALRHGGIDIVAIHNHMTMEHPRIMFLHYWGVGSTTGLARTLGEALARTSGR